MGASMQSELTIRAEDAYVFRHAILRDAAYQLQLPAARASLHRLALEIIEHVLGGKPAEPLLDGEWDDKTTVTPRDIFAEELIVHARHGATLDHELADRERRYLARAARLAEKQHRNHDALELWRQLAAQADAPLAVRAAALHYASIFAQKCGQLKLSETLSEGTIQLLAESGSAADVQKAQLRLWAAALCRRGSLNSNRGEFAPALECVLRAQQLQVLAGNRIGEAVATRELAIVHFTMQQHEESARCLNQALAIARELDNRELMAECIQALGDALFGQGRVEEAEQEYVKSRQIFAQLPGGIPLTNHAKLAVLYTHTGRVPQALEVHLEALNMAQRAGNLDKQCTIECNVGVALQLLGRREEAARHYREAISAAQEYGNLRIEVFATGNMATLLNALQRFEEAEEYFARAIDGARRLHAPEQEALWVGNLGAMRLDQHRPDEALDHLEQALAISTKLDNKRYCGIWQGLMAQVFAHRRELGKAARLHRESLRLLDAVSDRVSRDSIESGLDAIIAQRALPPLDQWPINDDEPPPPALPAR